MPRPLILLLAAFAAAACLVPAGGQAAGGLDRPRELNATACSTVKVGTRGAVLYRRGLSCTSAKRWVRRLAASRGRSRPPGYACSSGSGYRGGGYCERGRRHFGWHAAD